MKKSFISLIVAAFIAIICAPAISASDIIPDLPYESYSYNNSDNPVVIPAPYALSESLLGEDMDTSSFTDLSDIFYDGEENIYISDSGNNRIVITDTDFNIFCSTLTD